jgi:hypothetical protein
MNYKANIAAESAVITGVVGADGGNNDCNSEAVRLAVAALCGIVVCGINGIDDAFVCWFLQRYALMLVLDVVDVVGAARAA